jgi:hypothetical protein
MRRGPEWRGLRRPRDATKWPELGKLQLATISADCAAGVGTLAWPCRARDAL